MKLYELMDEFADLDDDEKLQILVEMADELPPLSAARSQAPFPESCRVRECQTPVFLWVDVVDGRVRLEADVPVRSPTVRGIVSLVVQGCDGATVEQVLGIPDDLLIRLGLDQALGMTRQQGFRGVLGRIKRDVRIAAAPN